MCSHHQEYSIDEKDYKLCLMCRCTVNIPHLDGMKTKLFEKRKYAGKYAAMARPQVFELQIDVS